MVGLVVLEHDFTVFGHFRGSQGLTTTLGVILALFAREAYVGLIVCGMPYLITHLSDISAGIGCGLIFIMLVMQREWLWVEAVVVLMLIILPLKFYGIRISTAPGTPGWRRQRSSTCSSG